ncbi:MAG TPA: DNA/RNA non-specific endonuclease, partial [Lacunisphaera sp.]
MKTSRLVLFALLALFAALGARATINVALQMQLGNPSGATSDTTNHAHYLIQRDQFAMDYNDTTHEPNWVSWDLTSDDVGGSGRSNFIVDTNLPGGFYQVLTTDYSGSGYDRGHMCPSADRTVTTTDNQAVFVMSNMIPQAPDNNQGVWASFENYC